MSSFSKMLSLSFSVGLLVVFSPEELKEFLHRQNSSGEKIILPLLYGISINEFNEKYPELNEIQVLEESMYSKEEVTVQLAKELIKFYKER